MTEPQPSRLKIWAQTQLGKVVLKFYQAKMSWSNRFGKNRTADDTHTP